MARHGLHRNRGMDLKRIHVVLTTGDLKDSKLNPQEETLSLV
jgi:hypothetical protein